MAKTKKKKSPASRRAPLPAPAIAGENFLATLSGPAWPAANAAILALWCAAMLWVFEDAALRHAANIDGGILFALACVTFGFFFAACGLWSGGRLGRVPSIPLALAGIVPLLVYKGATSSAGEMFTFSAFPAYIAANALFSMILMAIPAPPDSAPQRPRWMAQAASLALAAALAFFIWKIRGFADERLSVPSGVNAIGIFYLLRTGGGATDIGAGAFHDYARLMSAVFYLAALGGGIWYLQRSKELSWRWTMLILVALTVWGKLSISLLSDQGLGILSLKISSVNTNYYELVKLVKEKGVWGYMSGYNSFQIAQRWHGDTHPFGPVLLYWLITCFVGMHPAIVAAVMLTLTAFTAPVIYKAAEAHFGRREAGLAAAALYLTTPMSLILSSAGIDAVIALFVALALWAMAKGIENPTWKWGAATGAFFFLGSLFSFGIMIVLMFAGLWSLDGRLRRAKSAVDALVEVMILWGPLLGAILLCHLLLFGLLGGHFNYLTAMNAARGVHRSVNVYRTYELWSWANVVLYSGYAGVATLAAFLIRAGSSLWRQDSRDGFLIAAIPFIATLIFACMGRAEIQREFLFGVLFLSIPAAGICLRKAGPGEEGLDTPLLIALASVNVISTVILEMVVLDYW